MKILNIAGKAKNGKTSVAEIIKRKLEKKGKKVLIMNYADTLKFYCREYFGWDGNKDEDGRGILQKIGTDIVRQREPDFWVRCVANFISVFGQDFDLIIIPDCRFVNECEFFKDEYHVMNVRIERLNFDNGLTEEQKNHPSETSLNIYCFDYYLESESGLKNLEKTVGNFMKHLNEWL